MRSSAIRYWQASRWRHRVLRSRRWNCRTMRARPHQGLGQQAPSPCDFPRKGAFTVVMYWVAQSMITIAWQPDNMLGRGFSTIQPVTNSTAQRPEPGKSCLGSKNRVSFLERICNRSGTPSGHPGHRDERLSLSAFASMRGVESALRPIRTRTRCACPSSSSAIFASGMVFPSSVSC